jgi:hypothetical protein
MTVVSEIITDAYRETDVISINATPTAAELAEGLRLLNRIRLSVFGNEAGELLLDYPIGRNNIDAPAGFPFDDRYNDADWFLPTNRRVVLNLEAPMTIRLHPSPDDGARFGLIDASGNLATRPVTIDGNGRFIDGGNSLVLNTDGYAGTWFYSAADASWRLVGLGLLLTDTWSFPDEFDSLFIIMLAMRINPRHSLQMDQQSLLEYKRGLRQFQNRYRQVVQVGSEIGLIRLANRSRIYRDGDGTNEFNVGRGYSW